MPRGTPKPFGGCELAGCYRPSVATVEVWHDHVGGYRSATFRACREHAEGYDAPPPSRRNGSRVAWDQVPS